MSSDEKKARLADCLAQICDGRADEHAFGQLNDLLRDDPAARAEYLETMLVHGLLEWERSAKLLAAPGCSNSSRSPMLGFLGQAVMHAFPAYVPGYLMLCVALCIGGLSSAVTAMLMWSRPAETAAVAPPRARDALVTMPAKSEPAEVASAPDLADTLPGKLTRPAVLQPRYPFVSAEPLTARPEFVATLVGASALRWQDGNVSKPDGERLSAGEVRIAEGVAEIIFDCGGRVILEGPAWFSPQSQQSGILRKGRLVVRMPRGSPLFALQTANAVMVSSGGEFAVEAESAASTKMHVFSGEVDVAARSQLSSQAPRPRAVAGESVVIDALLPPRTSSAPLQGNEFIRALPSRRRHFPRGLISYWNFDERGGPAFDLRGQSHGVFQDVARVRGLAGAGAVEFDDRPGQFVMTTLGEDSAALRDAITVEAMFVSRWSGKAYDYDHILRHEDGPQRILLAFQNDTQEDQASPKSIQPRPCLAFGLHIGGQYSELEVLLDGKEGRPSVADITDGHPHHVAATYDSASGVKSLYLDGVLRASKAFRRGDKVLFGDCRHPVFIGGIGGWQVFRGVLDEIALYARGLTPEEVAEHWRLAKAGRGYFETTDETATGDDAS